ncbi:unnamed protein product [Menidia menidia]|uniref:(Atlantic silverside) hypothetical protein n=1 Tax=Menidia menidia TaxID=238744 RepID=A0A8S4AHI7_9TELE|nr:unnamed protein product [Menidia menidia]
MRDPCRICGVRLVGSQCRWIFSSSGQRKLQVILSHVLGREVIRDGRGEFLCGKCVFQLEKVVQCDINISRLQDEHSSQIQKLQADKENLIQCIVHIYSKNNPGSSGRGSSKIPVRSSGVGSPVDDAAAQLAHEKQQFRESGSGVAEHRMRRCVSLDRIASKGTFPWRSGLRGSRLGSGAGIDAPVNIGLRGTRHRSQSMYLDLVQRKGTLARSGFKGRSASLQSLNRDFSSETPPDPQPKRKLREPKVLVARYGSSNEPGGKSQAKALLQSSSSQPSVISDLIQILRCISKQQVSSPAGSRIPVLRRVNSGTVVPRARLKNREAEWKSLHEIAEEFNDEYTPVREKKSDVNRLQSLNKTLTEELNQIKSTNENLTRTLEDSQNQNKTLSGKLEEKENELNSEKKNALKRDKTIQGLTEVLKEKEKEIAELCREIEDRDDALTKAREAAHKAQLQKYQGVEEHQNLLMEKQTELSQLQGEHHAKVLEAQKLQRGLERKEQELADMQQTKDQLEMELEDVQQQKKKGDKALNDLNNQLKKLNGEMGERENALEQQYQELLDQTKRKLQSHEVTIQRLTSMLADKEQQLQEYINMIGDLDQSKSPGSNDSMLVKLRQRLKEKESALEKAVDEKFAAIEEKDNEIHQLQLSLREKERDLERLNNLLSRNEETINNWNDLIKEKDVELQHLANTLKNLQRAKQDVEDNLNRSLREKDSIINQLQLSLEGKTKDMEEMAESMMSQSQTHARDLAEQMGQRLKVTEAMLAEAVKARERLVADNESAVEGLLATISSKDQLLKESAERFNRMLSERTQEIQELRKQLADKQQQLTNAERQSSSTAQESYLETAELKALLAEKDSLINKLLQSGQERDQFLAEMSHRAESEHVLELRQTIQIMQEKLDERQAELSRRNSEDSQENNPLSKKTVVVLKKELAQKTEALNKALKRENELKISLAELQSLFSELEGRGEGQAANIESLTATLKTKEEIINVLHLRLGQGADCGADHTQDQVSGSGMDRSPPVLPQREMTMIGGDRQQEALPNLMALQQEQDALNKALRAEQQLYSSLVRTVKEQDSAQRLQALQLELTAVQLLRQQLEDSIKTNEELRDDLEREINRAKLREGMDLIDPKELESMRHQLEDAQRWNASLQARLGAIQNRGGGVGGASDGDTLSFVGDQTSYMSICVGEAPDDSLSQLSAQELRQKVQELQDCVSGLQSLNNELQSQLSLTEKSESDSHDKEGKDLASRSRSKQQLEKTQEVQPLSVSYKGHLQDKATQASLKLEQVWREESTEVRLGQSGQQDHSDGSFLDSGVNDSRKMYIDVMALQTLLSDCRTSSASHLRDELLRLRSENMELRGLLKEQKSAECKEKESTDASGNSSDGQAELRKSVEPPPAATKEDSKVIKLQKERGKQNFLLSEGETLVTTESTAEEMESSEMKPHSKNSRQHAARLRSGVKSRLPVPVRLRMEASNNISSQFFSSEQDDEHQRLNLGVCGSDHQPHSDFDAVTEPLHSTSAPCSPTGSEARALGDQTQNVSALFTQLELLHQECQEKEALINKLGEQLSDWEELHAQLQEKERLNHHLTVALQAAQSTIAYLTACSLDSQGGFVSGSGSDAALHSQCLELQKALQEKEELNSQLINLLNMAERIFNSNHPQEKNPEIRDFCLRIEGALEQLNASSNQDGPRRDRGGSEDSLHALQQHADSLQKALLEQSRLNAELQEQLRAANVSAQRSDSADGATSRLKDKTAESLEEDVSKKGHGTTGGSESGPLNDEMLQVLMSCFSAAESAVASLAAHCANTDAFPSRKSSGIGPDFHVNLDKLQRALQERRRLTEPATKSHSNVSPVPTKPEGHKLPQDLLLLHKVCSDHSQRLSDLQASLHEERGCRGESEAHRPVHDARGLPPSVQVQLETLHKALREKKKACKSLEEKLASALTKAPETAHKAPEQGDKGVQVDLQDLGYETSAKSENDREENSSTDLEVGVNPSCSSSSLKNEPATFSSTENLDSTSSTPYPSSPALSSAKVSLKSLQAYDEYGASEDPLQLRAQVRELKAQLENQTKLILQMQSLQRRSSPFADPVAVASDPSVTREQEAALRMDRSQERSYTSGKLGEKKERASHSAKEACPLNPDAQNDRNKAQSDHLQQSRSRSTSPARLDSLVQSQARELSQLRQQIKESRKLGALQRRQLEDLSKAFKELLHAGEVDCYMGEVVKTQLDKSLSILDRLEGRLDRGDSHLDNEDGAALDLSRRLAKELQEKNRVIQSLQSRVRGQSQHSSISDLHHSSSSCHSSPSAHGGSRAHGQQPRSDWTGGALPTVGGAQEEGVSGRREAVSRLEGLQRENGRLQEQLRSSEDLNATLRSELDLHRSIMAQTGPGSPEKGPGPTQQGPEAQTAASQRDGDIGPHEGPGEQSRSLNADLLAEHLQEIRALRRRLEESIRTNDQLREQLERRLAEVEKDPASTNIFIQGNEDQGQLANEVRFLWEQNQTLKEQLSMGSRDKQKENEKLRETLARRAAKLEQSRKDCEALRQENLHLQETLRQQSQEQALLQDALRLGKEELHRLQCEVKLQRQQLSDSQHLLQSLRVELHVHEKMRKDSSKHDESPAAPPPGPVDLAELLSEIRHLRLQLERSIQTNTALRQKLEEQLLRGAARSETININYLLSSAEEGGRSPGREGCEPQRSLNSEHASTLHDVKRSARSDGGSVSSGSGDSASAAPSRLVPGHRMWANRNGRHVLGLIEDYEALRKQIGEGRKLARSMDAQLEQCALTLSQQAAGGKAEQQLRSLAASSSTMLTVLEEAGRLLKLLWRVAPPAGWTPADGSTGQQDELLKNEIARLKSRLSQQERMLSGAVKRLRSTNQLKEGMERVIIDQLSLTHGVLKKARGNLETNYCALLGMKGPPGGAGEGGAGEWPVVDTAAPPEQRGVPVSRRTLRRSSASSGDRSSD